MQFSKLHGLGNDFLVSEISESEDYRNSLSGLARRICDRHLGVGADGIVFYRPTKGDPEADFSALIFNADGSKAEMSGNGIRCLAALLVHTGLHPSRSVRIRTVSGIKSLNLKGRGLFSYRFECSMGQPIVDPEKVPALIRGVQSPIVAYPLEVERDMVKITICSMGNPHCSTFWPDVALAPVEQLGPALERHAIFPNRTNVEFIQVIDRDRIKVRFWERGVGQTLSSGTGSSAAAVASILGNLAESPLKVETELGALLVDWKPGEDLKLTGPADYICSGDYPAGNSVSGEK